jgi:hypothetical protein
LPKPTTVQLAVMALKPAGSASVTLNPLASDGPALVTVIV